MNIFNDGYLNIQYLNPNYRGIVGFPADWHIALHMENEHWEDARILTTHMGEYVSNGFETIKYWGHDNFCRLRIPQFAIDDIPLDEYCWVNYGGEWKKETYLEFITAYDEIVFKHEIDKPLYCVPTLIAETKEDAENLKDWNNPDGAKHNIDDSKELITEEIRCIDCVYYNNGVDTTPQGRTTTFTITTHNCTHPKCFSDIITRDPIYGVRKSKGERVDDCFSLNADNDCPYFCYKCIQ